MFSSCLCIPMSRTFAVLHVAGTQPELHGWTSDEVSLLNDKRVKAAGRWSELVIVRACLNKAVFRQGQGKDRAEGLAHLH